MCRTRARQLWHARPRSAGRLVLTRRNPGQRAVHLSTPALSGKAPPPERHGPRNTPITPNRDLLVSLPAHSKPSGQEEWLIVTQKGSAACVFPLVFQESASTSIAVRSNRSSRRQRRSCSTNILFPC